MKLRLKNVDSSIWDTLITILIEVYFLLMISNNYSAISNRRLEWYSGFVIAFGACLLSLKNKGLQKKELQFYFMLLIVHALSVSVNHNLGMTSIVQYFRYIFIAVALPRVKLDSRITRAVLWCLILFFLSFMLRGVNADAIIRNSSVNAISAHLILFEFLFLISADGNNGVDSLIVALLSMFIIIWSGSRSGIIGGFFIILASLKTDGYDFLKRIKIYLKYFPAAIAAFLFIYLNRESVFRTIITKRMIRSQYGQENLLQDVRFQAIREYAEAVFTNIQNFIWGESLSNVSSIVILGKNPHNSYIQLYAMFGFAGFFIVTVLIIRSLYLFYKNKHFSLLFLLMAIFLRSFSDILAFVGYYDPLFWYMIFEIPLFRYCNGYKAEEGIQLWREKGNLSKV